MQQKGRSRALRPKVVLITNSSQKLRLRAEVWLTVIAGNAGSKGLCVFGNSSEFQDHDNLLMSIWDEPMPSAKGGGSVLPPHGAVNC